MMKLQGIPVTWTPLLTSEGHQAALLTALKHEVAAALTVKRIDRGNLLLRSGLHSVALAATKGGEGGAYSGGRPPSACYIYKCIQF